MAQAVGPYRFEHRYEADRDSVSVGDVPSGRKPRRAKGLVNAICWGLHADMRRLERPDQYSRTRQTRWVESGGSDLRCNQGASI